MKTLTGTVNPVEVQYLHLSKILLERNEQIYLAGSFINKSINFCIIDLNGKINILSNPNTKGQFFPSVLKQGYKILVFDTDDERNNYIKSFLEPEDYSEI